MTQDQINKINEELSKMCLFDQGVFVQPAGIPDSIKEQVVYYKSSPGGITGGDCWGDSDNGNRSYTKTDNEPNKVLDVVINELCPGISYAVYRKIQNAINRNDWSENEYYGNCTNWKIEYITVSELERIIAEG